MSGAEHYEKAERLLADAEAAATPDEAQALSLRALGHAMVAQAAAAAYPAVKDVLGADGEARDWARVTAPENTQ